MTACAAGWPRCRRGSSPHDPTSSSATCRRRWRSWRACTASPSCRSCFPDNAETGPTAAPTPSAAASSRRGRGRPAVWCTVSPRQTLVACTTWEPSRAWRPRARTSETRFVAGSSFCPVVAVATPRRTRSERRRPTHPAGPGQCWAARGSGGTTRHAAIDAAAVVVVQAGESAVADVAARRRPAVVVPAPRPFDEQVTTGRALALGRWPCRVEERFPARGWNARLAAVAALDGQAWAGWCDGGAADRLAEYLTSFSSPRRRRIA